MIPDWGLAGVFLLLILLEGVRRPVAGAVLVRRVGAGAWRRLGEGKSHFRLVSVLPPFTTSLILTPPEPGETCDKGAVQRRWDLARRAAVPLNLLGSFITLGLLVGLPLAAARLTAMGFLMVAALLLVFTGVNALLGSMALQRMGMPPEQADKVARRWLSPFAAPGVAEGVLELALADAPPAFAARLLLPEPVLREWLRPRAYDLMERHISDPELMDAFPAHALMAMLKSEPQSIDPAARAWCPRCGHSFRDAGSCTECGVQLLEMKLKETREGFRTTLPSTTAADQLDDRPSLTAAKPVEPDLEFSHRLPPFSRDHHDQEPKGATS